MPYPSAEYTQLGLKAGQEFWYRAQLVDRTGNESGWTDWVRGVSNANADDYLGDIADDFLTSADGGRLTGDIDTNLEAALQNAGQPCNRGTSVGAVRRGARGHSGGQNDHRRCESGDGGNVHAGAGAGHDAHFS